jgi:predicted metal-binding membrane protein
MVNRKQRESGRPHVATSLFALGYLAAWAGFSLVAVILQWAFERTGIALLVWGAWDTGARVLIGACRY